MTLGTGAPELPADPALPGTPDPDAPPSLIIGGAKRHLTVDQKVKRRLLSWMKAAGTNDLFGYSPSEDRVYEATTDAETGELIIFRMEPATSRYAGSGESIDTISSDIEWRRRPRG